MRKDQRPDQPDSRERPATNRRKKTRRSGFFYPGADQSNRE
nr:MAG TPA_asm: hypothetical protein [Caudoviricetes sp.]